MLLTRCYGKKSMHGAPLDRPKKEMSASGATVVQKQVETYVCFVLRLMDLLLWTTILLAPILKVTKLMRRKKKKK